MEGHSGPVYSVVFSVDSSRLASASHDKTVKVWDAISGQCLRTLEGHSGPVSSVVFSANSSRLASASGDKTVKIWDASSGMWLETLKVSRALYDISFDHTGSFLNTEGGDLALRAFSSPRSPALTENTRCARGQGRRCRAPVRTSAFMLSYDSSDSRHRCRKWKGLVVQLL
ncbi:hypothetical protein LTR49_027245 [Elasticomyces elasticus]|nr:hypothetical protein LTR49_027245 [Elasticomyces elasticus]